MTWSRRRVKKNDLMICRLHAMDATGTDDSDLGAITICPSSCISCWVRDSGTVQTFSVAIELSFLHSHPTALMQTSLELRSVIFARNRKYRTQSDLCRTPRQVCFEKTPNEASIFVSPAQTCGILTNLSSNGVSLTVCKRRMLRRLMRSHHNGGEIDFAIWFGSAPLWNRTKSGACIIRLISMLPSSSYVLEQKNAILVCLSKENSLMMDFSGSDDCAKILSEFVACSSAERLDSNHIPCGQVLVGELTVRNSFASILFVLCSPMTEDEAACSTRSLFLRGNLEALNAGGFSAST